MATETACCTSEAENTTEQDADKKKIKYKQPIKLPTMKL